MSTYNLLKTIHNIWLREFGKKGAYLYVITSNMCKLSSNQHCIMISFIVVAQELVQIGMNCDCIR